MKRGEKEKRKKNDKTHVKIPLKSLNDRKKNLQKQGRILELEGGGNFSGWPEYIVYTPEKGYFHKYFINKQNRKMVSLSLKGLTTLNF